MDDRRGGRDECQRVERAAFCRRARRSLLLHPRLLLIDEPSLGLDPRMVEAVFSTIVAINREGTTVVIVEQNARQALAISDRGFVLELGRNRFEDTGQALLADPDVRAHYLGG